MSTTSHTLYIYLAMRCGASLAEFFICSIDVWNLRAKSQFETYRGTNGLQNAFSKGLLPRRLCFFVYSTINRMARKSHKIYNARIKCFFFIPTLTARKKREMEGKKKRKTEEEELAGKLWFHHDVIQIKKKHSAF